MHFQSLHVSSIFKINHICGAFTIFFDSLQLHYCTQNACLFSRTTFCRAKLIEPPSHFGINFKFIFFLLKKKENTEQWAVQCGWPILNFGRWKCSDGSLWTRKKGIWNKKKNRNYKSFRPLTLDEITHSIYNIMRICWIQKHNLPNTTSISNFHVYPTPHAIPTKSSIDNPVELLHTWTYLGV